MNATFRYAWVLALLLPLAACGGGSSSTTTTTNQSGAVVVSPKSASLVVGATQQFTAAVKDAQGNVLTGASVTWSASPASVASIDSSGLATAVATGTATITATSGSASGSASLTVTSSGSTPPALADNQVSISANGGVTNDYTNGVFTSVTVCVPQTTNCTTVNNVLVDTGSYGLRLLSSALGSLPLPASNAPDGNPLGECAQYVSTFNWGPVATADVKMGGETAFSIPIQVMGASGFPVAPSSCSDNGSFTENDTQQSLGANGILGIGVFRYDCGGGCSSDQGGNPTSIPPYYFSCPSAGCTATLIPLADEVQNPVSVFEKDNNGVLIALPSVAASGAMSADGTMTFGIGTQSDNQLTGETVLGADTGYGDFETVFEGNTYQSSVIDSGSNANFFLDASTLSMATCSNGNDGFYCPGGTSPIPYTATNVSADGSTSATATWTVANAQNLFNTGNFIFSNLAGPAPNSFDFGLSFFFGKTIAIGFNGAQATSNGNTYAGPFYGY